MTVPRDKLESVCRELDHALRREQRAQQLLREQSQQLNDLGLKVDLHTTQTLEKEATLTDAVQVILQNELYCNCTNIAYQLKTWTKL